MPHPKCLYMDAYHVWKQNDDTLCAFILQSVSLADIDHTQACTTTNDLFTCLQTLHENQGAYAQNTLFMKALKLRLSYDTPIGIPSLS